jgi:PGF-CTERM protein
MKNIIKAVLLAIVILSAIAVITVVANKPIQKVNAPNMTTTAGLAVTGGITGRVTTFNTTAGIPNADVWILNANNASQYFWYTKTNDQGFFQLTNINNTWADALWRNPPNPFTRWPPAPANGGYLPLYKAYCNDSTFGDGYSNNFTVEVGANAWAAIIINPMPHNIVLTAKTSVVADGVDKILVSAYVTDALNRPVVDNTPIVFTFINSTAFDNGVKYFNGSVGTFVVGSTPTRPNNRAIVETVGGYANLSYGIVSANYAGNNTTITAAYQKDTTVKDSKVVFFNPTTVSWFGSVVDSNGNAEGGVPVTLHVGYFNSTGGMFNEVYHIGPKSTLPDKPYPGTYVFDNIIMWNNITVAYATANMTIQDNVEISGKSNYYSLNKTMTSAGFIVLHVPLPDEIRVTPNPDVILVGGDFSVITAKLYLNGNPYRVKNQPIGFMSNNDSIAFLPVVKDNVSDANGEATIVLTSAMTKGSVVVTAFSQITVVRNLTASCIVNVVGWGTISGMVTDMNKNGVPNATVTLYYTTQNASGVFNDYTRGNNGVGNAPGNNGLVRTPENPQKTVQRAEVAAIGTYTYFRIPSGIYNVTAEKADASGNNRMWFAIVNLTIGTATNNIAIPSLVINVPTTPSVTPIITAIPSATPTPTPSPSPTATPTPGFEVVFALAGLLGVACLTPRKEH